ncbi:MAG: hypothetical protein IJI21_03915 [Clostridia bacterium]|nr:hypothetical protein [Clostridia bacterium]
MKKWIAALMTLCLLLGVSGLSAADGTAGSEDGGKIVVLATGGTIAGVGEAGKTDGYLPGVLTAEELLQQY